MNDRAADERLSRLEERIRRIEEKLDIAAVAPEPQAPQETHFAAPPQSVLVEPESPAPAAIEIAARSGLLREEELAVAATAPPPIKPPPIPFVPKPDFRRPPPPRPSESDAHRLEQTIGLKWAGWIGAVVLVIGAALGVKYAYDNQWFAHLPAALRLGMIFAAGLALIAAGEYVFRRVNKISAASLYGAGAATLFLGAYAGFAYFDLYDRSTSMTLMGLSTLIGAAVAMRGNLVSIGVLSLIGTNLAPVLVATANAPLVPFLLYLLAMQIVALLLSQWGQGGKWWTLRLLALISQVIWVSQILASDHAHDSVLLAMMVIYALMYQADIVLAGLRAKDENFAGSGLAIAVTAAFACGVLTYCADASAAVRGTWIIGAAVVSGALGFMLPNVHGNLRRLATAHRIAGAALFVLWVPVANHGVRTEVGWMLFAIAFAAVWATTGSAISRVAAPVTWVLGLCHLANSVMTNEIGDTWLTIWGTSIGANIILAWLFALTGHGIAVLIGLERKPDPQHWESEGAAKLMATVCGLLWFTASIGGLPSLGATGAILAYAWLLCAADRMGIAELGDLAFTSLLIATVKWAAVDTLNARLSAAWTSTRPVLNSLMLVGALNAASLVAFHRIIPGKLQRLLRSKDESDPTWPAIILCAAVIGLMTIGLSFEIDRMVGHAQNAGWRMAMLPSDVRQLAWTILWSISVSALLLTIARITGLAKRHRWAAALWPIAGLLGLKFIVIDTLWPFLEGGSGVSALPIFNLDVLAGASVFGCLGVARWLLSERTETVEQVRDRISNLATALIGWMGTLEIARFVARMNLPMDSGLQWHFENLGWTMWWSIVAAGAIALGWRRDRNSQQINLHAGWLTLWPIVLNALGLKYLIVDSLGWRFAHGPVHGWLVFANFEVLTATVVLAGLVFPTLLKMPAAVIAAKTQAKIRHGAATLAVPILLVCGTMEVDRAFNLPSVLGALSDSGLAEQVGLSIFWSTFAVLALAVGFWRKVAGLRYFALVLLALTLLKVVVIDLSQVGYGYRVLSFLGLGLLLLFTSVMYGKISPKLLAHEAHKPA